MTLKPLRILNFDTIKARNMLLLFLIFKIFCKVDISKITMVIENYFKESDFQLSYLITLTIFQCFTLNDMAGTQPGIFWCIDVSWDRGT